MHPDFFFGKMSATTGVLKVTLMSQKSQSL